MVPGDAIQASVVETSPNVWRITVTDSTQSWTFTKQFGYTTPGASAEWVEEAPTVGGGVATLSDYGSATFTDMGVTGPGTASAAYTPVYMADPNASDLISWPDTYTGTGSFTVHYGSPDARHHLGHPGVRPHLGWDGRDRLGSVPVRRLRRPLRDPSRRSGSTSTRTAP